MISATRTLLSPARRLPSGFGDEITDALRAREEIDLGQCSVWEFSHHETIADQDGVPKGETRR